MRVSSTFIIFSITLLASSTLAIKWGSCPTIPYQENFDITQYLGTWYEATRMKGTQFQTGDCSKAEYGKIDDTYISVKNSEILSDGKINSVEGEAYCEKDEPAECHVRFSSFQPWGSYNVLQTDYKTYTVVYSCANFYFFYFEYAWVLTRSLAYDVQTSAQFDTLAKVGVTKDEMMIHDLSQCNWP